MTTAEPLSRSARIAFGTLIILLALLLLAGGWMIPFKFESFSILYKFGPEKTYLRSGKVIGITIVILLFFQILLASRFTLLERIFSLKRLLFLHRMTGVTLGGVVVLHPLLIKMSENFTPYIFESKYYPEFIGIGVLTLLLFLIITALLRNILRLSYPKWLLLHRSTATLLLVLLPTHVLFVSETFKVGLPKKAALVLFSLNLFLIVRIWLRRIPRTAK